MRHSAQRRIEENSGKEIDFEKLLSDPKSLDEACAFIRDVITLKARADDLIARERVAARHRDTANVIRDVIALKARAYALAMREQALVGK